MSSVNQVTLVSRGGRRLVMITLVPACAADHLRQLHPSPERER